MLADLQASRSVDGAHRKTGERFGVGLPKEKATAIRAKPALGGWAGPVPTDVARNLEVAVLHRAAGPVMTGLLAALAAVTCRDGLARARHRKGHCCAIAASAEGYIRHVRQYTGGAITHTATAGSSKGFIQRNGSPRTRKLSPVRTVKVLLPISRLRRPEIM